MLERIYVDNYKCLVNFEYRPGALQLLLGGNGSGKSTVFEVLGLLRRFLVDGESAGIFSAESRTRWQELGTQTFELECGHDGNRYAYRLVIEHQMEAPHARRVRREELSRGGEPIFVTQGIRTPGDPVDAVGVRVAGVDSPFLVSSGLSALSVLASRPDVAGFHGWLSRLYSIQANPYAMLAESDEEAPYPLRDLSNYASWYRHLSQERPRVTSGLLGYLKPIIPGFEGFSLTMRGETTRTLRAETSADSGKLRRYRFDELSEGQRVLTCLYTLLALMKEMPVTLCIDEPDNFVSLPEIEPWLMELHDVVTEHGSQALVISHHPDILDYLALRDTVRFSRGAEEPARVAPFAPGGDTLLTAAEIVRRGWEEDDAGGE